MSLIEDIRAFRKNIIKDDLKEASLVGEASRGLVVGSVVGVLATLTAGWWAALPRTAVLEALGPRTGLVAGAGALYQGSATAAAQWRNQDDALNHAIGGAVMGAAAGCLRKNLLAVVTYAGWVSVGTGALAVFRDRREPHQQQESKNFFAYPKPDPFAKRWAEMNAKE